MSILTMKDHMTTWQDKMRTIILNKLTPGLIGHVFFQDADPYASIQDLDDEIRCKTTEFTDYHTSGEWEIQAGAALIVAIKLVMGHDYISNESSLFYLISAYIHETPRAEVVQKLLCMESVILNRTIFNVTTPNMTTNTNKRKREVCL